MFCENCGAQLPEGSKFCGSCGSVLAAGATSSTFESNPEPQAQSYNQTQYQNGYQNYDQSQYQQNGYQNYSQSYEQPQGAKILSAEDSEAYAMAGKALKFGILSVCFSWFTILGVIFGINGITKFRKANKMGSKSPKKYVGLGLSIYGLIMTAVLLFYFAYIALIFGVAVGSYADSVHSKSYKVKDHDKEFSKIIEEIEAEY